MRKATHILSSAVLICSDIYTLKPDRRVHGFWGQLSIIPLLLFGISQALDVFLFSFYRF